MAIKNTEKGWVKRYQAAAGLTDFEYRSLLKELTGKTSTTDPQFSQGDLDLVMAHLEGELHEAVTRGAPRPAWWTDATRWRRRCPAPGGVNSRQLYVIRNLQRQCGLAGLAATDGWLLGVARHAARRSTLASLDELTSLQAGWTIEALKDRLRQHLVDTQAARLTQGHTRRPVPAAHAGSATRSAWPADTVHQDGGAGETPALPVVEQQEASA